MAIDPIHHRLNFSPTAGPIASRAPSNSDVVHHRTMFGPNA